MRLEEELSYIERWLTEKSVYHWPPKPTAADAMVHLSDMNQKLADIQAVLADPEIAKAQAILSSVLKRHRNVPVS